MVRIQPEPIVGSVVLTVKTLVTVKTKLNRPALYGVA